MLKVVIRYSLLAVFVLGCGQHGSVNDAGDTGGSPSDRETGQDSARPDIGACDPNAVLYAPESIPRYVISLSASAIESLKAKPDTYVTGEFRCGDEVVLEVGVRLRGTTSFQPIDKKPSLKIKFDKFVPGQSFHGLRRLTFNNASRDPSFMAEILAYRVFRAANMPAPRANHALISINGQDRGLYVNVETEDKTFIRGWFGDDSGNLYESEFEDIAPGQAQQFDLETNEKVNDRSDLVELCAKTETLSPETMLADLSPYLDMDRFLRYLALEMAVNQRDGYATLLWGDDVPGNFRLYHNPTDSRFVLIPWSMDRAMVPPHLSIWSVWSVIGRNCLQGAACRAGYKTAAGEVATLLDSLPLVTEAEAMRARIVGLVAADSFGPGSEAFKTRAAEIIEGLPTRAAAIRAELEQRP